MEYKERGPHGMALDFLDADGRPLGERNASSRLVDSLLIEDKISTYAGRSGCPMNTTAYSLVAQHREQAFVVMRLVWKHLDQRMSGISFSSNDLWVFSRVISSIPSFLAYGPMRQGAVYRATPAIAAAYKMGGGPFLTSALYLADQGTSAEDYFKAMNPQEYLGFTVNSGAFVINGHACAAPPKIVFDFLKKIDSGFSSYADKKLEDIQYQKVAENIDDFMDYSLLACLQDYVKIKYAATAAALAAEYVLLASDRGENIKDACAAFAHWANGGSWLFGIRRRMLLPDGTNINRASLVKTKKLAEKIRRVSERSCAGLQEVIQTLTTSPTKDIFAKCHEISLSEGAQSFAALVRAVEIREEGSAISPLRLGELLDRSFFCWQAELQKALDRCLNRKVLPLSYRDFLEGSEMPHLSQLTGEFQSVL